MAVQFTPIRDSARRYIAEVDGNTFVVSRYAHDKFVANEIGIDKLTENAFTAEKPVHQTVYNSIVRDFRFSELERVQSKALSDFRNRLISESSLNSAMNMKITDIRVRGAYDSAARLKEVVAALKSKDNTPTGAKAKALVEIGRRDPEWQYEVGNSPGVEGTT